MLSYKRLKRSIEKISSSVCYKRHSERPSAVTGVGISGQITDELRVKGHVSFHTQHPAIEPSVTLKQSRRKWSCHGSPSRFYQHWHDYSIVQAENKRAWLMRRRLALRHKSLILLLLLSEETEEFPEDFWQSSLLA